MLKRVYFRYGIVMLTDNQEKELKRIYKESLLLKMGLGRKFSCSILYSRKSALGVGIIIPKTIINIFKAILNVEADS